MNITEKAAKLAAGIKESVGRFPHTVAFALALTVTAIVLIHTGDAVSNRVQFFLYWFLITGTMLSLGLSLLCEERRCRIVPVAAYVLWAGIWVLMSRYDDVLNRQPYVLIFAALVTLAAVSVVLLPFVGRKEDMPMWNFTLNIVCTAIVALFVALVLWGGLSLLLLSFEKLFGLNVSSDLYEDLACFSFFFVAPMLVLQGIPSAGEIHSAQPGHMPAFLRGAVRYLFIPLVSLYFITLYSYAVKIIITWKLPEGWVSYLVSASMLLVVLLQYAIRPYRHGQAFGDFAMKLVCSWLPKLMLPLLVLMSVGIVRRVSDYGITVSRAYLIAFNLWCYVACIILSIKEDGRIMWLSLTPLVIFVLISVFPVNVSSVVRDSMLRQVRCAMDTSDWNGTPMSKDDYSAWLDGLDRDLAFRIDSKLDYLKTKYPRDVIGELVVPDVLTGGMEKEKSDALYLSCYRMNIENLELAVPDGMTKAVQYDYRSNVGEMEMTDDSVRASFPLDGGAAFTLSVPMTDLRALSDDYEHIMPSNGSHVLSYQGVMSDGRKCVFFLNHFSLRSDSDGSSMDVSGMLFY